MGSVVELEACREQKCDLGSKSFTEDVTTEFDVKNDQELTR